VRILTYNFLGGGSAVRDAWKSIGRLKPDILLAQECRCPHAGAPRQAVWAEAVAGRWGTGLFLARGGIRELEVRGFSGWIAGGELDQDNRITARPLRVFSIHCPAGEHGYVKTMNALLDAIAPLAAGADLVLGGDFNVACGMRRARDPVPFGNRERALLERMAREFDLMPCWQAMHPRAPLAQTLRWTGNRATPYHCDGIFAPRAWRSKLVRCRVIAGAQWDRLSDHNPVLAVFASEAR
jgi:exonuclease III